MKKLIYTLPLLLALGACSNEDVTAPEAPTAPVEGEGYYMTFTFEVPDNLSAGTRADNDKNGIGDEAKIEKIDLYLLDADTDTGHTTYDVLWAKKVTDENASDFSITGPTNPSATETTIDKKYSVEVKLTTAEVDALTALIGHKAHVLVVCNPHKYGSYNLDATTDKAAGDAKFSYTSLVEVGTGQVLPMTNAKFKNSTVDSFNDITSGTSDANKVAVRQKFTAEGAKLVYNLTSSSDASIDVERALARLDLGQTTSNDWDYPLYDGSVENGESGITLRLYSVTPVNVNNTSYVVRHGASVGTNMASNDVALLSGAWVADPSWNYASNLWSKTSSYLYNKLDTESAPLAFASAQTVVGEKEVSGFTSSSTKFENYFVWTYISENTVPSEALMEDEELPANATGIYFKFQVLDKEDNPITTSTEASKFPKGVSKDTAGNLIITLAGSGKTETFAPVDNTYYLPYCGFITHDKEGNMKYSVVRNTIYQMKINKIENLPNPENALYYLTLDINVLKWNSRQVGFDF